MKAIMASCKTLGNKIDLQQPCLITIGFSHFSEKARWALDLTPLQYNEDRHLPALHISRTLSDEVDKLERLHMPGVEVDDSDKFVRRKERTAVPKLMLPKRFSPDIVGSAAVVKDGSRGIIQFVCTTYQKEVDYLYPASLQQKIVEVENYLENQLSLAVTNFAFGNFLLNDSASFGSADNSSTVQYYLDSCANAERVSFVERQLFSLLGHRVFLPLMIKANYINVTATQKAKRDILAAFEYIEEIRSRNGTPSGSKYMFNTVMPTMADISWAAFAAPVLLPKQTNHLFFNKETLRQHTSHTPGGQAYLELSDHLLAKFSGAQAVMQLYAEDRQFRNSI